MSAIRSQKMALAAYGLVAGMQPNQLKDNEYFKNEKPEKALSNAKSLSAKYRTLALTFPNMILQAGLSQSVGFLLAKGKLKQDDNQDKNNKKEKINEQKINEHLLLLKHLAKLLSHDTNKDDDKVLNINYQQLEEFHGKILNANLSEYQLLTREALDAASCLKRYTQALLEKE